MVDIYSRVEIIIAMFNKLINYVIWQKSKPLVKIWHIFSFCSTNLILWQRFVLRVFTNNKTNKKTNKKRTNCLQLFHLKLFLRITNQWILKHSMFLVWNYRPIKDKWVNSVLHLVYLKKTFIIVVIILGSNLQMVARIANYFNRFMIQTKSLMSLAVTFRLQLSP